MIGIGLGDDDDGNASVVILYKVFKLFFLRKNLIFSCMVIRSLNLFNFVSKMYVDR